MVQRAEAIVILKQNKNIQNCRLQECLHHVPTCSNLCWQMLCRFVSFVTVVHRQPLTDLHPHSPVFRSLLYPCRGCSLREKQNICAGQAGAAGRSRSAEQCEEGQNLPLRALFNQKEPTVSDLAKRILNPAPVQFQLPSSCKKPLETKLLDTFGCLLQSPLIPLPAGSPRNDYTSCWTGENWCRRITPFFFCMIGTSQ